MSKENGRHPSKKPRRYLAKSDVMRRYAWQSAISVDRAVERKTIPAPIYVGRRPLWLEEELDARDERARESSGSAAFSPERKRAQALFLQRARQGRKFQRGKQNRRRTRASA